MRMNELIRILRAKLQMRLEYVEQWLWQMTTSVLEIKGNTFENKADIYLESIVTPTLSVMTTSSAEST